MKMKKFNVFVLILAVQMTLFLNGAELTGLQIIENVNNRDTGKDSTGNLTMTLVNSQGHQRVRVIKQFIKNMGEVEKKIMFFVSPADVRNTSFLNWSYENDAKDDDQWIYLPALKKVKRISSDSKNDYFMGSDFTYDDLGDRKPGEDQHKLIREEVFNGEQCYVVESIPKDEGYIYSKTVSWVIRDKWIGMKKEFYDETGELLKTLNVKKFEKIEGIWVILHSEMANVQKKHRTVMELSAIVLNKGIPDNQFTERMMQRGL